MNSLHSVSLSDLGLRLPASNLSTPQSLSGEPRFNVSGCFNRDIIMDVIGNHSSLNKCFQDQPSQSSRAGYHDNLRQVLNQTKKIIQTAQHKKTKGSMYVSDLWGEKHRKTVIRAFQLDKAYENNFQARQEEIQTRLEALDNMMRRKKSYCLSTIPTKVLEEFNNTGLNSPKLRCYGKPQGDCESSQRKSKSISWKQTLSPQSMSYKALPVTLTNLSKIPSDEASSRCFSFRNIEEPETNHLVQDLGLTRSPPKDGAKIFSVPISKKKLSLKKIEPLEKPEAVSSTEEVTMKIRKLSEKSKTMPFRKVRRSIRVSEPRTQSLRPILKNPPIIIS